MEVAGIEGCTAGRVFCIAGRCAAFTPAAPLDCGPGSPKRRKPLLVALAPPVAAAPLGRFKDAAPPAMAGRSLAAPPGRPATAAPEGRLPCSMARCCCANGTRAMAAGCRWVKNRVEDEPRGANAAKRAAYCRLVRLGAIPTWPWINPALRNCSPPGWLTLPNRPLRKSSAATDETPFATRAFLYTAAMFTLVKLTLRLRPP